jgi:hypothetical protein
MTIHSVRRGWRGDEVAAGSTMLSSIKVHTSPQSINEKGKTVLKLLWHDTGEI